MSIFKRLTGKKKGGKSAPDETPLVLDETADLAGEDVDILLPKSAEDAIPSLSGFTDDERDVIRSILLDEKTPRFDDPDADLPEVTGTRQKKTVDEILKDNGYQTALGVLRGEIDTDDIEETEFENLIAGDEAEPAELNEDIPEFESEIEELISEEVEDLISDEIEPAEIEETEVLQDEKLTEETEITAEIDDEPLPAEISASLQEEEKRDPVMTTGIDPIDEIETELATASVRSDDETVSDTAPRGARRSGLREMRMDITQISSDIEQGDSMFRRAQQRVENLTTFIERAEVDFSLLDRLEPENRALKSENLTLNSELEKRKTKISQLNASLEDIQRRYGDAQSELDATHSKLAQTSKNLERSDRDIKELNIRLEELRVKSDRARNDLDVENRENSNLRTRITEITEQLDRATSEKLNFAKQIETLKIDVTDQTENREKMRDEASDLRFALEEAQRQNTQMRGEITSVHEEIRGFKTQYEFNILKRDERISDLESQIIALNDKLRMKEDLIENTTRDISLLRRERTAQDLERERLEQTLKDQSSRLHNTEDELLRSKKFADDLDQKYKDVADSLARNSELRQQSRPVQTPDISPSQFQSDDIPLSASGSDAPRAERIAPTPQITDDIEDMLTDYKLGLRNSI